MRSAVLFLVFNRPETTRRVFQAIRAAQPPRLYVAADGPRQDREGEIERCAEVRRIATNTDWPCEVKTLFRDKNLGCKPGVSGGINWYFEHEEDGIILEDDVLPLPTFFRYCDELLQRYRDDESVGLISGSNLISKRFTPKDSYFFSRHSHIWGWASWRRAWQRYDGNMQAWPAWRDQGGLELILDGRRVFESYWRDVFDRTFRGEIDSWAYPWLFACWYHGMVGALPAHNQTHNLGYGTDATHTTSSAPIFVKESIPQPLVFPLRHPSHVERSPNVDMLIDRNVLSLTFIAFLKRLLGDIPVLGECLKRLKRVAWALCRFR